MAKIKASTLLRNPADGEIVFLREGENAPAWAEALISNTDVLESDKPAAKRTSAKAAADSEK